MAERHRNNPRLVQQAPERISGSREMMPDLFRAQTRIDTHEQNSRPARQNIAQWHWRNCTTPAREASPTRSSREIFFNSYPTVHRDQELRQPTRKVLFAC